MSLVRVSLTPNAEPVSPRAVAVIVDVLRATTTLSFAFANGARAVLPAATPEAAVNLGQKHPGSLLCGERNGRLIPGFDLGNSPAEYTRARVAGRTLVFASTNGSIAMIAARPAVRRLLGAFVNANAVVDAVTGADQVAIVCSGKLGGFSLEDAAFAGWLCRALAVRGAEVRGPGARFAESLAPRDAREARAVLESAAHGRYLRALGGEFLRDVGRCSEFDVLDRAFAI